MGGNPLVSQILHEVKEFAGFVADAGKEVEIILRVVAHEVGIAALIGGEAAFKEFVKFFVPGHVGSVARKGGLSISQDGKSGLSLT